MLAFKNPDIIKNEEYCETVRDLRTAIKRKRSGIFTEGVIVLHDNARLRVARTVQVTLRSMRCEELVIPHTARACLRVISTCSVPSGNK
jgi:hypothetical protein